MTEEPIRVEVAYARKDEQVILPLEAKPGITAREAIERSGIVDRFQEIDLRVNKIGIFGRLVAPNQILEPGDRVEIYRPLVADPKEARKKRAAQGKVMRKGASETKP